MAKCRFVLISVFHRCLGELQIGLLKVFRPVGSVLVVPPRPAAKVHRQIELLNLCFYVSLECEMTFVHYTKTGMHICSVSYTW